MQAPRYKSFIICTSPRSGSTLLCKLLSATKVA
ncbi:MAG: Stf0 family sulfotransferase, partial [Pseudomonadota bacterium]